MAVDGFFIIMEKKKLTSAKRLPFHRLDSFHFSPSIHKCNQDGNGGNILLLSWDSLEYILHINDIIKFKRKIIYLLKAQPKMIGIFINFFYSSDCF